MANTLRGLLRKHEGLRLKPYKDTVGKLTIGVGRNLDDVGISEREAMDMLDNDILRVIADCRREWPDLFQTDFLDDVRKAAFYNLCFNMGIATLMQFKGTFAKVRARDWKGAAENLRATKWATQVQKERVDDITYMVEFGKYRE